MVAYDFSGKVAIVTGAARGVGRAIVSQFVKAGANVVGADRDEAGLRETCQPHGNNVRAVVADISTLNGASAITRAAVEHFGQLDICVNDAAVAPHASLLEERVEVWDQVRSRWAGHMSSN